MLPAVDLRTRESARIATPIIGQDRRLASGKRFRATNRRPARRDQLLPAGRFEPDTMREGVTRTAYLETGSFRPDASSPGARLCLQDGCREAVL